MTLSTAESCTGGRIAAAITAHSGASNYFRGGLVAYQNDVKEEMLGVPHEMIATYGVVSRQVAGCSIPITLWLLQVMPKHGKGMMWRYGWHGEANTMFIPSALPKTLVG